MCRCVLWANHVPPSSRITSHSVFTHNGTTPSLYTASRYQRNNGQSTNTTCHVFVSVRAIVGLLLSHHIHAVSVEHAKKCKSRGHYHIAEGTKGAVRSRDGSHPQEKLQDQHWRFRLIFICCSRIYVSVPSSIAAKVFHGFSALSRGYL